MYKGPDYWDPETGHWEKRSVSMGNNYDDAIAKLMAEVFKASFSVSGGGTYEKGNSVTPRITWSLKKEDVAVPIDKVWIDGTLLPPGVTSWSPGSAITATHTYNVRVQSSEGTEFTGSATYTFRLKKYWGVVSDPLVTPSLSSLSSEWATSWTKSATTFDCTGGKYPMYIIPANLYSASEFQIWIGGLRNTAFDARRETLSNSYGSRDEYVIIYLNVRQTGVLSIEFKHN